MVFCNIYSCFSITVFSLQCLNTLMSTKWLTGILQTFPNLFPPKKTFVSWIVFLWSLWSLVMNKYLLHESYDRCQIHVSKIVQCRYNAARFITILTTALLWHQHNLNQSSNSQPTPHTSPSLASYGVSIMRILKKTDRIITAPHCICKQSSPHGTPFDSFAWMNTIPSTEWPLTSE